MSESKFNLSGATFHGPTQVGDGSTQHINYSQSETMTESFQSLFRSLSERRFGKSVSPQKVAEAVNETLELRGNFAFIRTTVGNWLNVEGSRPKEWWQACALTLLICDNTEEANRFLAAAKHVSLSEKKTELEARFSASGIDSDNIEAVVFRKWRVS